MRRKKSIKFLTLTMLGIFKMDCPHEKLEEMYGINFCVECGEEISITIGEMKGGFYKHGRQLGCCDIEKISNINIEKKIPVISIFSIFSCCEIRMKLGFLFTEKH